MASSTKRLVIAGVLTIAGFVSIHLFDDWKVILSLIPFIAALIIFLSSLKQLAQEEEIYLAGLRRGDTEATSFQCELQHNGSYSGRDLRHAIDAAREVAPPPSLQAENRPPMSETKSPICPLCGSPTRSDWNQDTGADLPAEPSIPIRASSGTRMTELDRALRNLIEPAEPHGVVTREEGSTVYVTANDSRDDNWEPEIPTFDPVDSLRTEGPTGCLDDNNELSMALRKIALERLNEILGEELGSRSQDTKSNP